MLFCRNGFLSVILFLLFLLTLLVLSRRQLFNSLYSLEDMRCDNRTIKKTLQVLSETGSFPQSIEPDLKLYLTVICLYYGKSDCTYNQRVITEDHVEALKTLRLLIEKYPFSFVIDRAILAQIIYSDVWATIKKDPSVLSKLKCDKERLNAEYYSQLSIANAYGYDLGGSADNAFINGNYKKAFHYYRRQGISEGLIYCYEHGIGTKPLPKVLIWGFKSIGWLLGDFDFYSYKILSLEYNAILKRMPPKE